MAHHECELTGQLDSFLDHFDAEILRTSASAQAEDRADFTDGGARMAVRVYERYSAMGGNRVSLNLSVLAVGEKLSVSAITAGGSQAVFFKMNTFGEEAFLEKAVAAIGSFAPAPEAPAAG
ncbi:MAG TPA: DUF6054 family protein [Marmoricola sp.]